MSNVDTDQIEIQHIERVDELLPQILHVYSEAFSHPPYNRRVNDVEQFSEILTGRHAHREAFHCVAALLDGRLLGFAYGYHGAPGQFWHDQVRGALGPDKATEWLDGSFEFTELAVLPETQGRGIGSRLHDELLTAQPFRTTVATTLRDDNPALQFYLRRGWERLHTDFLLPGGTNPQVIIGNHLNLIHGQ